MSKMPILVVKRFNQFRNYSRYLLTCEFFIIFLDQRADKFPIILLKEQIIEQKMINGFVNLSKQSFNFLTSDHKILIHHLFQVSSLFRTRVHILTDNMSNLFQSYYIMSSLIFLMMPYASLHLTYCCLVRACQTTSKLDNRSFMDIAQMFFILWVSQKHSKLFPIKIIIILKIQIMQKQAYSSVQEQSKRIGDFMLGKTIGQGTFNKVKIARHIHSKEQVAIKLIDKSKINTAGDNQRLIKQLKILRKARHPNIIQLYQILQDHNYYYVVTEFASRGELFDHIVKLDKLSQFQASKYLQQILNAVEYLQQMGVVHRDLKPENVLLDYKFNVKIIDFGLSNIFSKGESLKTACGSPCYAAPEMLSGSSYDPLKIDIWSSGIILYAMCFGFLPFDHSNSSQLYELIKHGKYQIPQHASQQLIDLLGKILQVNPEKRASIQQIRNHNFCKSNPNAKVSGIIPGLSIIPFEETIETQMKQLSIDTKQLEHQVVNNKHTNLTSTYYLLLYQWLRQKNQSILSYYNSKYNLINRYKVIQKVKEMYDKRVSLKLEELSKSRKFKLVKSQKKKLIKFKSAQKKYRNRIQTISKFQSKQMYSSPQKKKRKSFHQSNSKQTKKNLQNSKFNRKLRRF